MKTVMAWAIVHKRQGRLAVATDAVRNVRGYGVMVTRAEAVHCLEQQRHAEKATVAEVAIVPVRWWNRPLLRWMARRVLP